jgi:bifunctional UDP-N-acetylglucosamine pyrophosphorylase/glucosamine-1-phosphate N-acetyltransferase
MTHVIILAAGHGTRMKTKKPKVMHTIANKPIINHVIDAALTIGKPIIVCSSNLHDYLTNQSESDNYDCVIQSQALGTGHAVLQAVNHMIDNNISLDERIVILYGDTPLLTPKTLKILNELSLEHAWVGAMPIEPHTTYGRLVMNPDYHSIHKIVEFKDANDDEKNMPYGNAGGYCLTLKDLKRSLDTLKPNAISGEYYLTDIVEYLNSKGTLFFPFLVNPIEFKGVNTLTDLSDAEHEWQHIKRLEIMANGVKLINPTSVFFSHDTCIENDVVIDPFVTFGEQVTIHQNTHIHSFCHIENSIIGHNVSVGPFAHLRGGNELKENSLVGNFVELKSTVMSSNSKAKHLSYLGDAYVGDNSNIGAGTITCNYDGFEKHKTYIGKNASVGCNSALVAPLRLGDGSYVGAGSVITEDVATDSLGIGRAKQIHKVNWAKKRREMKKKKAH